MTLFSSQLKLSSEPDTHYDAVTLSINCLTLCLCVCVWKKNSKDCECSREGLPLQKNNNQRNQFAWWRFHQLNWLNELDAWQTFIYSPSYIFKKKLHWEPWHPKPTISHHPPWSVFICLSSLLSLIATYPVLSSLIHPCQYLFSWFSWLNQTQGPRVWERKFSDWLEVSITRKQHSHVTLMAL